MQGALVVVSGFSGTGKGTVIRRLLETRGGYCLSVSVTTRAPREGEVHGREYFFITRDEFQNMIENDELLEYATYVDNSYGTPESFVREKTQEGMNVLLEIEIQGALKVKAKHPEALLVFLIPPSAAELEKRLTGRGTEDAATVRKRLSRAAEEADVVGAYDYVLINDDLDTCVEELDTLVKIQKCRQFQMADKVSEIKRDLKALIGGKTL
ncbi:MAG: guanylate kinase [Lachnospiraceae bacterium]|nr:guanylate kinase [Lachnospiraceae bacterium]